MRENIMCVTEAIVQIALMLALYPIWFIIGLYARMTRRDKFDSLSRVCGMWIFPAWGKWYLPMVWLNWHY